MIALLHVIIALGSVLSTTYLYFRPSKGRLRASYTLIAATLGSGTYLVVSTHAPLLGACTSGLLYLGIVSTGLLATYRKLEHAKDR